jgi:hypothetical protein
MPEAKQREQKVLKLFILLMLPVVTLAGFGGFASILMLGLNPGKTVSATWSPDGSYRARVMEVYGAAQGCGNSTSYVVFVERRWNYIKTGSVTPFCFIGSSSQIAVSWTDSTTLSIACTGCNEDSTYTYDQNWGRLHFQFDLQRQ